MRLLAELSPDRAARLTDVLITSGKAAELRPSPGDDGDAAVWVVEEDDLEPAKETLAAFLAEPDAPKFVAASKQAEKLRAAAAKERKAAAKRVRRGRDSFRDATSGLPLWQRAPVSAVLFAVCVVVALFGWGGADEPWSLWERQEPVVKWLWIAPIYEHAGDLRWNPFAGLGATFEAGQLWRLFTPMFLHGSPLHLAFNMSWLLGLGVLLESRFGSWRYLASVLAVAGLSNVAEFYLSIGFGEPVLGLFDWEPSPYFGGFSGVAVAFFGFELGRYRGGRPIAPFSPGWAAVMLGFLVLCVAGHFGGIANTAHLVGLGLGFAGGFISAKREDRPRRRSAL
ncbi:rhomboid family intramembrane serine protease [Alienimonas chondri]|uniref:Rhomboid protease GlpG n=1 Tax=Alienimonas chondri TaxID=2681879 RepID=A0ABX1VER9_9PLAN|nr:rhomboid family intramembrane serine protease [Alienimonas chondri]NNJ26486.1 Rhomboid protease GlpG [Alienimonas chondri]